MKIALFGVKDTTETILRYIHRELHPVDYLITIRQEVTAKNHISGYRGLGGLAAELDIPIYEASSYYLRDEETLEFFADNHFDIGIVVGWQRLIPKTVLDVFSIGVFGFHGNCGYLPFGRGRSPLNWSVILGDRRFNLNLFKYDEEADSPNVFATEMFSINEHDDIRTLQYKNLIASKRLIKKLVEDGESGCIAINTDSKDFDSWYNKRTPMDGKIDFHGRTRDIYNLIRGVTAPFPGAFCYVKREDNHGEDESKVVVWEARPFDEMMNFSGYCPGEIIDIFDEKPVVRTVDGSLIIHRYDYEGELRKGDVLC